MKFGELVWVVLVVSSGRGQEVFVDLRLGGAKLWINYLRAAAWRGVGEPRGVLRDSLIFCIYLSLKMKRR